MKVAQGLALETGLGAYGGVVQVEYDREFATQWIVDHFAEIGLAVALVPVSALIVLFGLCVRGWVSSAAERAFVAVAASAFVLVVIQVGLYASRFALRIEERNMTCVAPLLMLALALWLARGLPRPWLLAAVAGLVPATFSSRSTSRRSSTSGSSPTRSGSSLCFASRAGSTEASRRPRRSWGPPGSSSRSHSRSSRDGLRSSRCRHSSRWARAFSYTVLGAIRDHSQRTLALTSTTNPSWIDERIGSGSKAAYVYGTTPDYFWEAQILWQTEFWNRSLGPVYTLGPADPGLTASPASFDPVTGRIVPQPGTGDSSEAIRYVVAPTTVKFSGRLLDQQGWLALYRIDPPIRLATFLGGVYADGWMGDLAAFDALRDTAASRHGSASAFRARAGAGRARRAG